jgi:hypothetical protein
MRVVDGRPPHGRGGNGRLTGRTVRADGEGAVSRPRGRNAVIAGCGSPAHNGPWLVWHDDAAFRASRSTGARAPPRIERGAPAPRPAPGTTFLSAVTVIPPPVRVNGG